VVLSVAAFFRRSFRQFGRNPHKFCRFWWGTKICPNWPMVTWGVTKFLHKDPSAGNLNQFGQKELVHVGSLASHSSNFDRMQHGSRSHECVPWRRKSLWREWLRLNSWFSLRNRHENVQRLLHQRKEITARKGRHLGEKSKHFIKQMINEPCASLFLLEVSRTLV